MEQTAEQIAAYWIAYARHADPANNAPEQVRADAMSMHEMSDEEPDLAWDVIRRIIGRYPEEDFFGGDWSEAQRVVGLVAAGPIKDLLGFHGADFIDRIEAEAQCDRRMAWALGGVWQFSMPDHIWERVQRVAYKWPR